MCEILFPLLIFLPICYGAYTCLHPSYSGGGCQKYTVGGWGGNVNPSVVGANGPHARQSVDGGLCSQPDDAPPPPPGSSDYYSATRCTAWTGQATPATSFAAVMTVLQWARLKMAWVVEDPKDRPKLDKMISYISQQWYPGLGLHLPENDTRTGTKVCYEGLVGQLDYSVFGSLLGYDQYRALSGQSVHGTCSPYGYGNTEDPGCCLGSGELGSFEDLQMPSLKTEADLKKYLDEFSYDYAEPGGPGLLWGAVVFRQLGSGDGSEGSAGDWDYTIRLNGSALYNMPSTDSVSTVASCSSEYGDALACARSSQADPYSQSGFLAVQLLVDRYILHIDNGNDPTDGRNKILEPAFSDRSQFGSGWAHLFGSLSSFPIPDVTAQQTKQVLAKPLSFAPERVLSVPLPAADSVVNDFYEPFVTGYVGLFFVIAFLVTMYGVIVELITEKQTKMRESLKMLGVQTEALLASFYLLHACVFYVLCLVLGMYLTLLPGDWALFPRSSPIVVIVLLWLWCMAFVAFCFAFHTLFDRAMAGGIVGALLMLVQFILYAAFTMWSGSLTGGALYALSVLPNCALCAGLNIVATLEAGGSGLTFSTLAAPVNGTSALVVLGLLLLDIGLWTLLGLYLERVFPKEFGVRLPPWFIFDLSYWRGHRLDPLADNSADQPGFAPVMSDETIEPSSTSLRSCIEIRALRKCFATPKGSKVAVHGLDLDCYEGQILALLGHNGAGKTTTINMLTGLLPPTSGGARILGYQIQTQMNAIRKSIGVCPQHDVLWSPLTVQQHLQTFAKLKGVVDPAACVAAKIQEVGLSEKAHVQAGQLSGGMKRKLSLCLALIGDASVIFLDEPTSGMDPFSRRFTWNLLIASRAGRAVVLTTHFMDEADLLGDRIAIMAEGDLQCCGSSLFLKNRFGAGYRLICTRNAQARCDVAQIAAVLQEHVPEATVLTDVGAEMTFQLPTEAATAFPAMLAQLEKQLDALGVQEYGISQVTMEEVFLKVGKSGEADGPSGGTAASLGRVEDSNAAVPTMRLSEMHASEVFLRHLAALTVKRAQYGRRDIASIFCALIMPALMLWICLGVIWYVQNLAPTRLQLDVSQFKEYSDSPSLPYTSSDNLLLSPWSGLKVVLPQSPRSLFFGRTYSSTGFPTDCSVSSSSMCDPSNSFNGLGGDDPPSILSMMEKMWADGLSSSVGQVTWGGLAFPAPTASCKDAVTVLSNVSAAHATPTFTNAATNALRKRKNKGVGQITVANQPLPSVGESQMFTNQLYYMIVTIMIVIAFSFVPAATVAFPVMESEVHHNSRHQQYISGVSIPAYWLSNYIWDLSLFLVLMAIVAGSLQAFQIKIFIQRQPCVDCVPGQQLSSNGGSTSCPPLDFCAAVRNGSLACDFEVPPTCTPDDNYCSDCVIPGTTLEALCPNLCGTCGPNPFEVLLIVFAGYGFAVIPVTYLFSLLFKRHTRAQMVTLVANILFGLLLVLVSFLLSSLRSTRNLSKTLIPLFRLSPGYNIGNVLFYILGFVPMRPDCSPPLSPDLMQWEKCGANVCVLFVVGTVCLPLLMALDYLKNFPSVRAIVVQIPGMQDAHVPEVAHYVPDADVQAEEMRVLSSPLPTGQPHDDVLVVRQLRKVYGRGAKAKVAVRGLTLGLKRGSCFGFLGINGAGKTTTLNILTGAQLPSSGQAWLGGKDILSQQDEVRRLIGYCPQHDALLEKLSVREHLVLFGRIKGVAAAELEEFVRAMISNLDLSAHEHKLASTLSGGNKRKLSVGIALMGSPQLVFLDEPSTGVDPAARRFMWDMIAQLSTQRQECTVVLTTHNMEEAEALCSVVGVMVGGRLRCLGSNQRLKARFGGGYQLEIKLTQPSEAAVRQLVASTSLPPTMALGAVRGMCATLGDASRAELVRDGCEEGYVMYAMLQNGGEVSAGQFAEWWLTETAAQVLQAKLAAEFGSAGQLLERHDCSFRYRIQLQGQGEATVATSAGSGKVQSEGASVASIFEAMEQRVCSAVCVEEYGLSQASLEQIFNQFAAQQEEESASVRGMNTIPAPEAPINRMSVTIGGVVGEWQPVNVQQQGS